MSRGTATRHGTLVFAAVGAVLALGCTPRGGPAGAGPSARPAPEEPAIDAEAKEVLKKMGEFLKNAKAFRVHAEVTFDEMLRSGQRIQFGASVDVEVRRPDRLHVVREGDLRNLHLWYDGKKMSLFSPVRKVYTSFPAPPTIDAALDHAVAKFGLVAPGADLVFSDPYAVLIENVKSGFHAGMHKVGGVSCHHLVFGQDAIDWQIWIEDGDRPVPRKLVITYKEAPDSPDYAAVFSGWDFSVQLTDDVFTFKPPEGAERIEILSETDEEETEAKKGS